MADRKKYPTLQFNVVSDERLERAEALRERLGCLDMGDLMRRLIDRADEMQLGPVSAPAPASAPPPPARPRLDPARPVVRRQ